MWHSMASPGVMALLVGLIVGDSMAREPDWLTDGKGGKLTYEHGFILGVNSVDDNFLSILRIVGDPAKPGGRMLSLNTHVEDDKLGVYIMAYAVDGTSPITVTEIFGNNVRIASCRTTTPDDAGKCVYVWPVASMIAGNNELRMEYMRMDGLRFQTYGRIGRP